MVQFKNISNLFALIYKKYSTLPSVLRHLLALSFLIIVIVEFYLKQYPAKFFIQEALGIFALNLSYSYLAGFILYYIVVFDPLEKKKIASHRILANRIFAINIIFRSTVESIYVASRINKEIKPREELDLHEFKRSCMMIHPKSKCIMRSGFSSKVEEYDSWYDALQAKANEIRMNIDIIMYYSDCIDADLLVLISGVRDGIETYFNLGFKSSFTDQDLNRIGHSIFYLYRETNLIVEKFGERHVRAYDSAYHMLYRNLYGQNNVK